MPAWTVSRPEMAPQIPPRTKDGHEDAAGYGGPVGNHGTDKADYQEGNQEDEVVPPAPAIRHNAQKLDYLVASP